MMYSVSLIVCNVHCEPCNVDFRILDKCCISETARGTGSLQKHVKVSIMIMMMIMVKPVSEEEQNIV